MADTQHLLFSEVCQITCVIVKCTHISRDNRDNGGVGEIVVVTTEAIAGLLGIKCIRYTHQLLRAGHDIVNTTVWIRLSPQIIKTIGPVNAGNRTHLNVSTPNLKCYQAVGIRLDSMCFHKNSIPDDTPLQDADSNPNLSVSGQRIVREAHHRLIGKFLRSLCPQAEGGKYQNSQKNKNLFHCFDI